MSSIIRLQNFINAAQCGFGASEPQRLLFTPSSDQVTLVPAEQRELSQRLIIDQNRRTWEAFSRALRDAIGENKMDRICRRYRFNLLRAQREGMPLLPEHIELFSVGASRCLTGDVKQRFPNQSLKHISIDQIAQQLRVVDPMPIIGWSIDPCEVPGPPTQYSAWFFHDPFLMDKETQILLSDVSSLDFSAWQERFCKCTINRELAEKQIIPAPGISGRVEFYKVYRKIANGNGLVAYALKPLGNDSTLKPIVMFRPSQFALSNEDAIETYMNDVQANIGELGYSSSQRRLAELMEDPRFCPPNSKVQIAGYSLGGVHAQRFLTDHWQKVSKATFYADPSVEAACAERFAQQVNQAPRFSGQPLEILILRAKGDHAHYFGDKHVGWGVTHPDVRISLWDFEHQNYETMSILELHGRRVLDHPERNYQFAPIQNPNELNSELNNQERGDLVVWWENLRKAWGTVAYWILYAAKEITKFFCAFLSIQILRSSKRI